jgi:phosphate transport system protein
MIRHFHEQLEHTKIKLLRMVALADRFLGEAIVAFTNCDQPTAEKIINLDDELNELENEMDDACLKLLALSQPVAADLRYIVAAMRLSNDIERIGDETKGLAKQTVMLIRLGSCKHIPRLEKMAYLTQKIYRTSVDSFRNADMSLAREVFILEKEADVLYDQIIEECLDVDNELVPDTPTAMRLLFIARCLERICDLSTNVAESTIFVLEGISIKHQWPELKEDE